MTHVLTLPDQLTVTAMESVDVQDWRWDTRDDAIEVTFGGRPLLFAEPVAVAMISAWSENTRARNNRIEIREIDRSVHAFRTGIAQRLAGKAPAHLWPGLVPARILYSETDYDANESISRPLEHLDIRHQPTEAVLKQCLEDLCRNVFHHAHAQGQGAHWAASYDRAKGLVRLGVADCGIGIAKDIQRNYADDKLSNVDAVSLALQPLITGRSQQAENHGVGLYYVRRLVQRCEGALWVLTRDVRVVSNTGVEPEVSVSSHGGWQGTAVGLTLKFGSMDDFWMALSDFREETRSEGPRFETLQFVATAPSELGWLCIDVASEFGAVAVDRGLARTIADTRLLPQLADGGSVAVDFSGVRAASQAFCHALLFDALANNGRAVLGKLQFVACSKEVKVAIRMAMDAGLGESVARSNANTRGAAQDQANV